MSSSSKHEYVIGNTWERVMDNGPMATCTHCGNYALSTYTIAKNVNLCFECYRDRIVVQASHINDASLLSDILYSIALVLLVALSLGFLIAFLVRGLQ